MDKLIMLKTDGRKYIYVRMIDTGKIRKKRRIAVEFCFQNK